MYTQKECNIRKKPSTEYEILDCLNKATEVNVTGKVNEADWYEVDINGEKGYIAASLLADTKPSDQQQQPQTQNPPADTNIPSGYTPNGDGTYTDDEGYTYGKDESGNMGPITPATGEIYKPGEKDSKGWTWGGYIPGF